MIIVKVIGGLGNQLFQYAAGLALSIRNETDFLIDASAFDTYATHDYCLPKICNKVNHLQDFGKQRPIIPERVREYFSYYKEESLSYCNAFETIVDYTYVDGYWQCLRYFEHCKTILQSLIRAQRTPSPRNRLLLWLIQNTCSVAVHIRRGDYVTDNHASKIHGVLPVSYYNSAFEIIKSRVEARPFFYIFSNDPEWAKTNIDTNGFQTLFISHNINDPIEDFRLMRACRHHIIANSTFSWWPAWLACQHQKIVISPSQWFSDESMVKPFIFEDNWLTL